jgi:hypothetical protein
MLTGRGWGRVRGKKLAAHLVALVDLELAAVFLLKLALSNDQLSVFI